MKKADFWNTIRKTPRYVPVFELVRVPEWVANHGYTKGDRFYHDEGRGFVDIITDGSFGFGFSAVKFIEYKKV